MKYVVGNVRLMVLDNLPGVPPGAMVTAALYVDSEDKKKPITKYEDEANARDALFYGAPYGEPETDSLAEPPTGTVPVWSSPAKVPR